ncbi:MAG: PrsW family intramembrane metalloprotease [Anaerolineales bacterium]|jgi:RsiW-degrading membrane proteinase PrsW (M82 family)|uniref:PrsW family intramembrane metalloprotease n=1 Tax=Candidatus Villigracilis vicinus TaxID=3140679 RepID=UPI0031363B47|nr:PrsW family intramembrane metalloprotease [Anaerolineales bacterium]MBK7448775.1 PrsW family intramembrane metalloprotease [Anaerolineales bacterium]MBK9780353.1 PrsW family intramembrane metalloprotease [Anaerolineales bacterium]
MSESKSIHERKHVWRDEFLLVIGLCAFVGLVYVLDNALHPTFTPTTLVLTGVFLALVPAFIWLIFFYLQDSAEPEPKGFVMGVFLLGGLLAAAVGIPMVEKVFRVSHWIRNDTLTTILGGILVVGFTQEFLKYAAVRYGIYHSEEFDEPTDGVIYATAAGLGYATMLNINFVISNGGVDLGTGILRMAVVALAQAAFSGITGYFLGRAKFESEPIWWMPLGISLAAVFNGLFNWLLGILNRPTITLNGSTTNTWMGLILAAVVALVTTGVILRLVHRNVTMQAGK